MVLLICRYAVTGDSESVTFTAAVKGTAAYMPPEAINCDVSAKWDTWSYGVVILELITGEYIINVLFDWTDWTKKRLLILLI